MVVAVVTVRVVEVAIDEVVDVIPVRNGWMPASRTMDVVGIVSRAAVLRGADCGVGGIYVDAVLVDMVPMRMV